MRTDSTRAAELFERRDGDRERVLERQVRDQDECLRRERSVRRELERTNLLQTRALDLLGRELRGPLNSTLAWARLLVREPLPTDARAQALDRIGRNTLMQLALVDEVFDLAQLASGQPHFELTDVDLSRVAVAAIAAIAASAAEKRLDLRLRGHEVPHVVLADRRHVTQLLDRLTRHVLRSARQHDGVDVTVTTEARHEVFRVAMVASAGAVDIDRLLAAETARTSRSDGGLDLYIATKLAALLDSDVELYTDPANRSIAFTVRLKALGMAEGELGRVEPSAAEPPLALRGIRVLIVDDDPDMREILGVLLASQGAVGAFAADARTAWAMTDTASFDVVISDIEMPGEDGMSLVRRLRLCHPEIPVVALSAFSVDAAPMRAFEKGFDAYLSKHTNVEELVATITRTRVVGEANCRPRC